MDIQNDSGNSNNAEVHNFTKGWSVDLDNHAEKSDSYSDSWNGRLYSADGTFAFVSINGSKFIYSNDNVVRYNGHYAFQDELIVFAKGIFPLPTKETITETATEITVKDFTINSSVNTINGVDFSSNYSESTYDIQVPVESIDEDDFTQELANKDNENQIDVTYNGLFYSLTYMPESPTICTIEGATVPINNEVYQDAIFSFSYADNGQLIGKRIFVGNLNIPLDAIITTEGVDENTYYKRVYFSDYYNTTRVVNVRDPKLSLRNVYEFDIKTKGTVLSPRIASIQNNGQLKAMTVFYAMKLYTDDGQVSDFSPLSKEVKIAKGTGPEFSGVGISELTTKSVKVDCYIPDYKNFKEVKLIAIEFESNNVPTSIRLVGTKMANSIVSFEHFGSEPEFLENITLADIFKNSISWKYNSDFTTKNNKLIVSGLRNDPLSLNSKNIALDFSLSAFDINGNSHTSLLNPEPWKYNFIDAESTSSFLYVQRRLYRKIEVFGNFKMKLQNAKTGFSYEMVSNEIPYKYIDRTKVILNFLLQAQTNPQFNTKFPNLRIKNNPLGILFEPINPAFITDFHNYNLVFSTTQVIVDLDNDTERKPLSNWPSNNYEKEKRLVYGGVSNGWFSGNGVRVTMHSVSDSVATKNTSWMNGTNFPLQLKTPTLKKGVMKGEIYRLGIQWFKNGNRLFVTILGDIKIPDIGQPKREIDSTGKVIGSNEKYSNWKVVGDEMFAERIELQFDVRINCELSKEVDSYQIVYVERTENNRTILAQGISAPLERISDFTGSGDEAMGLDEKMVKKWMLPSTGGPVYDESGLKVFDVNPDLDDNNTRVITNRKAFYFDSPDFIFSKISSNFVDSCDLEYVETVATDHDRYNIMTPYNKETASPNGSSCYYANGTKTSEGPVPFGVAKFSQKIPHNLLSGSEQQRPFWVNVSVFANKLRTRSYGLFQNELSSEYKYKIQKASLAMTGEILSGYKMNDKFDFANHALTLASPSWFYQAAARVNKADKYSLFRTNNIAGGRETVFIKTVLNYFSNTNIAQVPYIINSTVNFGTTNEKKDILKGHDAYIVSNLKRSNRESIYGGRTEFAYASNEYIPLSEAMPVISNVISSQIFYVEGDTYCTLYLRNKSSYLNAFVPEERGFHWSRKSSEGNRKYQHNKYNAWCYGVVLESTVEPRLNNSEEFYQFAKAIGFDYEEEYNPAYLQINDLKKSIPIPYNFKDDPILNNIIAASKVKLSGDYTDSWTEFLPNEFYELDKNMGAALNIIKDKDVVYVVQERQTSIIQVDERNFITPDKDGAAIQIGQGDGASISGHEILSDYGTSFRRAIVESPTGFVFFDELKSEIVKIKEPLLLKSNLTLEVKKMFNSNKVISSEGYYDDEFKETNIRFRTESGFNFVISYNELLNVFNGKIDHDNDLYMVFQNKVIAPYENSKKLGELNHGAPLLFFGNQKKLKLKIISTAQFSSTKINKGIAAYLNVNYPLLKTTFITSLGQSRIVPGTHHWYKIREGVHTCPSKNPDDYDDIRGEWCSIEVEIESKNNKEIKLFSLVNFYRNSYK